MVSRTILVVDDDDDLRVNLVEQLQTATAFHIIEANRAGAALELAEQTNFDLIIMDVGLPDMDGREAVKILREKNLPTPIIMLTGHSEESDAIEGFQSGANDYVIKPFRFGELLARIETQLRQYEQSVDAVFQIGSYQFKPGQKMLLDSDGTKIHLTEKESAIIKYLYQADGAVVGRETLLEEVWGYNSGVTTHTLETHVYRLRQKIEKNPTQARLLLTDSGGYRLVC